MKSASTRRLFDYWNERRGGRAAPERNEIEPADIRRLLADSFLLTFDPAAGHPLRLAGTRVCALFCRELAGEPFQDIWDESSRPVIRELVSIVADEASPAVGGVRAQPTADYPGADLELLLLPLYHQGRLNARMLGLLAPIAVPFWLGMSPVAGLSIGTLRHYGTCPSLPEAPHLAGPHPVRPGGRMRHGLVVYDGGQP